MGEGGSQWEQFTEHGLYCFIEKFLDICYELFNILFIMMKCQHRANLWESGGVFLLMFAPVAMSFFTG